MHLIIAGRVRKGDLWPIELVRGEGCWACDGCDQTNASQVLVSGSGKETAVCPDCLVSCGEPQPPVHDGVTYLTLAKARAAVANGQIKRQGNLMDLAEKYENAKRHWDRAIKPHGFKVTVAKPDNMRSLWNPYQ